MGNPNSRKQNLFTAVTVLATALAPIYGPLFLRWIESFGKGQELSYRIDGPNTILPHGLLSGRVTNLFFYNFHIENSGKEKLTDLTVKYQFATDSKSFNVIDMGRLEDLSTKDLPRAFTKSQYLHVVKYPRLEPGDVDANYFITSENPRLHIEVDTLKPKPAQSLTDRERNRRRSWRERKIAGSFCLFGIVMGGAAMSLLQKISEKRKMKPTAHQTVSI